MVNFYYSKNVESNFDPNFEAKTKDSFMSAFASLFGNLKSIALVMFMILTFGQLSRAQSTANYAFTTNTTGSLALDANGNTIDMSSGTTQLVAADLDNSSSVVTNIGFNFYMYGNLFSQFSASSNGVIQLGATQVGSSTYVLSSGSATTPRIGALAADLRTGINGKVHYKIVGSAPNRCLVVEFNNMSITYVGSPGSNDGTYQVRLYESSGIIEFVYGSMYKNASTIGSTVIHSGFSVGTALNTTASITTSTNTVSNAATFDSNSYTASTNIPNLHSTTDGSRRMYRFTPLSVTPADPTTLTFTAVTATTITPNWVDNSTDETYFVVTRATDAAFTQNVVTTIVNSTSIGTTGTAYNSPQTGLFPLTTYYFKIQSGVEAAMPSAGRTGSEITLGGTTYYWVGATGGNLSTAANWNTAADGSGSTRTAAATSDILIVDGDGIVAGGATRIVVDIASFTIGQFKVTNNTACTLESNSTATRTITLIGGAGDDFSIDLGSSLLLNHAGNAVAFSFSGNGLTGLISGTYTAGGSTSNVITTTGGTGTVLTVSSTGVVNNSIVGASGCLAGSAPTLVFADGSNYTHSGFTTSNAYIPTATWGANSNATLIGGTTGTGLTSGSTALGNLTFNSTTLTATLSAFTSATRTIQGNLTIQATNTGKFRAVTSGNLTINGNLIINGGYFDAASGAAGTVIVNGITTVNTGTTLDINTGILQQNGTTFTNDGTLTGTAATARLNFVSATNIPQTLNGTGTVLTNIGGLGLANTGGLTILHANQIPTLRVNLIAGTITNSNKLTMGTGAALAVTTQIGNTGLTTAGGFFDQSPVWNLGTGTYTLLYQEESVARTSGFEVPPTRTATNMTVANPNGLTVTGGNLEVGSALTLTSGIITTSTGNVLSLGTATAAGTLTGGSATAYVKGPFARTIASGNANSNYILYPVGKTAYNPISLAPATTAVSIMKAEAFDTNTGTVDASIMSLSSKRWEAPIVSGTVTNVNVRLGDSGISATNIPVQAPSAAGAYASSFGSVATYTAGTPNTITSNTPVVSGSYTGYMAYAISNICSGTPTPGATTTTASTVCLGGSVTLGITTIPVGSGVTFQWQSSPDGLTYTDIPTATANTYVATPTAVTYYQCVVTCSAGPVSGTSTPVQITFTNNITGTTPATRCGTGTVNLAATVSSGTINWYAAASGGLPVGSGSPFTTPSISSNTTYYAAAESSNSGAVQFGNGTTTAGTTNLSAFNNYRNNAKVQLIYTASELRSFGLGAGNITSIAFNVSSLGSAATNANYTVNIGTTALSAFSNTTFLTPAFTTCYGPSTYTHTANGWQTINFTTPYNWDGVSNLVLEISHDGINSSASADTYYTATTGNTVLYSYNNSASNNTLSTNRFNVLFSGQVVCSSPRVAVQATVTPAPTLTLSSSSVSICNGSGSSAVTLAAGGADYDTYVWSPATNVTGDSVSGWVFSPSSTTTYTLTASQSSGSLCTASATINVTVNPLPAVVTVSPASPSVCEGTVQVLSATGGTITASGSGTIGTATTLTTDNGIEPTAFNNRYEHYWLQMVFTAAELNAAGIQAGNINSVKFNITTIGSATNVSDFRVYMGNTALSTLTGFVSSGLSQVYAAPTYTQAVGVNSIVFNTPYVWDGTSNIILDIRSTGVDLTYNSSTYYTATADNKTVSAVTSTTFPSSNAFVASNPTATTSLKRLNVTFDYSANVPNPITWSPITDLYTDAAATIPYAGTNAATVYFKSNTLGASTYTATATSASSCIRTATVGVTVTPNRTISLSSVTGTDAQTVCVNSPITAITYAVGNASNATVTGLPAGVTGSFAAGVLTISGTPTAGGTFNYMVTPAGCGTAAATGVITVNQTPQPVTSAQTFCNNATVASLSVTGTAVQWYTDPTGGVALASTDVLATGTYYVTQTVLGCESPRLAVPVTVNIVAAPIGASTQIISVPVATDATIEDIVVAGSNIVWYASAADASLGVNALPAGTQLTSGSVYYATQTVGGCTSASSLAVTITVTLGVKDFEFTNLKLYPNPVTDILTIENAQGISAIEIYNAAGQKVMVKAVNAVSTTLDMSGLAGGAYLVKVVSDNAVKTVKVIKK